MPGLKAISLIQPYATLVAIGAKTWETRSWEHRHRGLIAIHAASTDRWAYTTTGEPIRMTLRRAGYKRWADLPLGAIVAVARLATILPTDALPPLPADEIAFGDFSPGRFAWRLVDVQAVEPPVPARGMPGLFTLPLGVSEAVLERLGQATPIPQAQAEDESAEAAPA